ncbi:hypothetical protein AF332_20095 [Sporosarcina globispora]|uniref:Restriction endonuclease type IV Mrr domain-containing protein n=1 Tax=Sporosarcina globispora TaxID=1459 RepID=A0A0M0GHB2_SPOGL|nr:restriction endonuclease [Sporosarcina globispora]KON88872.1 hypothetical protein AF332_20095 [Sporosarcina globispora]
MIDWEKVHPTHFEKFIFYTISKIGFKNRQWFGRGGGDRGRDVVATTYEELPFNLGYERKWIFQCKKWVRMPANHIIMNEILTASQHSPDFWVLVIPVDLTASQIDYIQFLNQSQPFKIIAIPLSSIEEIIRVYPETKDILINGTLIEGEDK